MEVWFREKTTIITHKTCFIHIIKIMFLKSNYLKGVKEVKLKLFYHNNSMVKQQPDLSKTVLHQWQAAASFIYVVYSTKFEIIGDISLL